MEKEKAIEIAENFYQKRGIEDEDLRQELYLAALEKGDETYRNIYNAVKIRFKNYTKEEDYIHLQDLNETEEPDPQWERMSDVGLLSDVFRKIFHKKLTERERDILKLRFNEEQTLEEIGNIYKVSRDRIRQIEAKALRKLRYCSRNYQLASFLDDRDIESKKELHAYNGTGKFLSEFGYSFNKVKLKQLNTNDVKEDSLTRTNYDYNGNVEKFIQYSDKGDEIIHYNARKDFNVVTETTKVYETMIKLKQIINREDGDIVIRENICGFINVLVLHTLPDRRVIFIYKDNFGIDAGIIQKDKAIDRKINNFKPLEDYANYYFEKLDSFSIFGKYHVKHDITSNRHHVEFYNSNLFDFTVSKIDKYARELNMYIYDESGKTVVELHKHQDYLAELVESSNFENSIGVKFDKVIRNLKLKHYDGTFYNKDDKLYIYDEFGIPFYSNIDEGGERK